MLTIRKNFTNPKISLFSSIFDDLFNSIQTEDSLDIKESIVPVHDIIENDNEFIVDLMLAGVKREDASIDVDGDILTIIAERKEVKDLKYSRKESFTGIFKRTFKLPETIDKNSIVASFTDGVLTVIIPKTTKKFLKKKSIEIM